MTTALALTLCAGCKEKNVNDARVDELMSKMTLAEKIGQLNQFVPTNSVVTGPDGSPVGCEPCDKRRTMRFASECLEA